MKNELPMANCELPIKSGNEAACSPIPNWKSPEGNRRGFSLVEILVVISLLSLIVIALMGVFSSTQRAFRASVTQSDVLEGGRSAMDLIASDLHGMTPCGGISNGPVNFTVRANIGYQPLPQNLPGSTIARTNLLNFFFILSRENTKWKAVGYIVDTSSTSPLYPLYRYYAETNITSSPGSLYTNFFNSSFTNMSHLVDGVVHLNVRAYDKNGEWIQQNFLPINTNASNVEFLFPPAQAYSHGEAQFNMFSNTVPAAVELELGILEDHAIARAESLGESGHPPSPTDPLVARQWNYLTSQAGSLHVFRQRVNIPNVDPSAYQ